MNQDDPVMKWLLEPNQPAVQYRALVDLLGRSKNDTDVRAAFSAIPLRGWAHDILKKQKPGGYWESSDDLYRPKYLATIWMTIALADLGLTKDDPRVKESCELLLSRFSQPDGGFDDSGSSEMCLTGNLARTFVNCGYANESRVKASFDWLVKSQKDDGGWHCFPSKKGTLDCWEGLAAFAALPRQKWNKSIKRSVERGAEFYLERRLYRQGRRYEPWFRFHYPTHYYYDLLVGLDVITSLGWNDDKRLAPALNILRKKQTRGRWLLDAVHPDIGPGAGYRPRKKATPFALEKVGKPSKWITMTALRVLNRTGSL